MSEMSFGPSSPDLSLPRRFVVQFEHPEKLFSVLKDSPPDKPGPEFTPSEGDYPSGLFRQIAGKFTSVSEYTNMRGIELDCLYRHSEAENSYWEPNKGAQLQDALRRWRRQLRPFVVGSVAYRRNSPGGNSIVIEDFHFKRKYNLEYPERYFVDLGWDSQEERVRNVLDTFREDYGQILTAEEMGTPAWEAIEEDPEFVDYVKKMFTLHAQYPKQIANHPLRITGRIPQLIDEVAFGQMIREFADVAGRVIDMASEIKGKPQEGSFTVT